MKVDSTISKDGLCWFLMDRLMCWFMFPLFILMIASLIPGIPLIVYYAYKDSTQPTFELVKQDWVCTQTYTYYIYVRGVRYQHEGCETYKRSFSNGSNKVQ